MSSPLWERESAAEADLFEFIKKCELEKRAAQAKEAAPANSNLDNSNLGVRLAKRFLKWLHRK